jgi:peptidyl-prolyl cis-trans isomerase A (cyclophilin A)/peptidyl-prolyl cis-trans isomerase B (cyclophilin B)
VLRAESKTKSKDIMMRKLLGALCALLLGGTVAFAANPQVEIKTNLGSITVELYADKAPQTVKNFLEYVQGDYYKGTLFHRVIPGFMIQGGGYSQDFTQKPTRDPIQNEAANGLKNETGTIAMARTPNPHSATAQFFINVADNAFLNHTAPTARGYGYTVFGKVVKGMDVVDRIAQLPTGPGGPFPHDVPKQEVVIQGARIVEAE